MHRHHLGSAVLVGLITFAFGVKVARLIVGTVLISGVLGFAALVAAVVLDTI